MQILSVLALVLAAVTAEVYFEEDFSGDWESRWQAGTPPGKEMGKFAVTSGKWFVDEEAEKGLTCTEDMRFYSITSKMPKMASSKGKPLVIQFSAKVQNHQYAYCGGGYIKLLPDKADYSKFSGDDEYNVMFGPDLCGYVAACARARAPRRRARGGGVRRARPCLQARRAPSCPLVAALFGPSAAPPSRSSCAARSPAPVACASGASRVRSYDVSHIHAIFNHKGKNLLKSEKVSLEFSR
jgi:hypothetical protein